MARLNYNNRDSSIDHSQGGGNVKPLFKDDPLKPPSGLGGGGEGYTPKSGGGQGGYNMYPSAMGGPAFTNPHAPLFKSSLGGSFEEPKLQYPYPTNETLAQKKKREEIERLEREL